MVFGIGKKQKEELERIKQVVSSEHKFTFEKKPLSQQKNECTSKQIPTDQTPSDLSENVYRLKEKVSHIPTPFAPLFIKLEKYQEIVARLQMLDELIKNTIEILKTSEEIEKLRREAVTMLVKNLQDCMRTLTFLNRELMKPVLTGMDTSLSSQLVQSKPIESTKEERGYTEIHEPKSALEAQVEELRKQIRELKAVVK